MSASDFRANNIVANLTGSLTELSNGDPYLLAGSGIEILTGSNGQVTINNVSGDITNVIAGAGLGGGGDTGDVTLTLDPTSNRNVDHSSVNINAGSGLTGGGSIDSDVNLSVNSSVIPFLSTENTFIEDNIFLNNIYIDDPTGNDLTAGKEILGTVTTITPNPDLLLPPTQTISQKMYINLKEDKYVFGEDRDETDFNNNSPVNATDVKILLSGSAGSKDGSERGVTLVSGDMVISGTLYDGTGNTIGGSGLTINNNFDNKIVTATGNNNQVNAEANLAFNGTALSVTGSLELTQNLNLQPGYKINFNLPGDGDQFIQYTGNSLTIDSDNYLNINADQNIEISAYRQILNFDFETMPTYKIQHDPWGSIFNRALSDEADFSVNSLNNEGILFIDSGLDVVVLGANDLIGQGDGPNDSWSEPIGDDVNVFISGSAGSKGSSTGAVAVVSGDLVSSGSIFMEKAGIGSDESRSILFSSDGSLYIKSPSISTHEALDFNATIVRLGGDLGNTSEPINNSDVNIFLSGSINSKGTSTRGTTLVGGDLVVSGNLYTGDAYKTFTKGHFYANYSLNVATKDLYYASVSGNGIPTNSLSGKNLLYAKNDINFESLGITAFSAGKLNNKIGLTGSIYYGSTTTMTLLESVKIDLATGAGTFIYEIPFSGSYIPAGNMFAVGIEPSVNWDYPSNQGADFNITGTYSILNS